MLRTYSAKQVAMYFAAIFVVALLCPRFCGAQELAALPARGSFDPSPVGKASRTAAESQPSIGSPATLAPVLLELQRLRETLDVQSERITRQTEELESERADLRSQLERIARIETELRSASGNLGGSTIAELAISAGSAPVSSSAAQPAKSAAVPLVSAQDHASQGSVDRRLGELEQRLKKIGPVSFSGDFRLREDAFFGGPSDRSLNENLQNFRLRFNVDVQLSDDLSGGFTLASGNLNDPTSTNQTLTGFYAHKPIALDRVFVKYRPGYFKPLTLVAGKFSYPWYNTELTWDKDLNPEGFAQTLNFDLNSTPVLKRIAFVGFELPFSQIAGTSLKNRSLMQTAVFGGQFQTAWRLAGWLNLTAYIGFYNFNNADPMAVALAKASSRNPATPLAGLLPLAGGGGTVQNSVTTTTATSIVTVNGVAEPTGVSSIANAQYASKFALFDSLARFDVKTRSERWPVAIIGDYVQNTKACANAGNILPLPPSTTTTAFSQSVNFACDSRQRRGYWGEIEVGRILQKHDLQLGYTRMFIEREAVPSNLNYNQIYQGSNVTEHRISAFYTLRNNVVLDFIGLFGRPLNFGNPNPPIDVLKRLQFDINYVF